MKFTDTITLDGIRRTGDGYLVADARVARTGIQLYAGYEVDPNNEHGLRDKATVRVYRPEEEVFHKDALHSYAHRPVTLDHPNEAVTADNWKQYAIGQTGGDVARDGEFVRVPLVLMDKDAISAVENGKRELSMGYATQLRFEDGVTPDGEPYDVVQTALRMNHLAVVTAARGGSHLKIGDKDTKGTRSMTDKLRTVLVDGLSVETTDQGAQAIEKLQKDKDSLQSKLTDAEKAHADAIKAKDADIAKKDAEIDDLKCKVLDGAALDAKVAARADLITKAKAIAPDIQTDGKSDAEIRKAAVVAKLGDASIADKSEAYIDARFDILAEDANDGDHLRDALTHLKPAGNVNDAAKVERDAHQKYLSRFDRKKSA
ncbi:DUF2213 domain-containing protein [Pelagibacterium sp. H642]|uniref:DUF2213 domain-containing protein n=1 Tax=Pelagibacterium sp. H642 TaxID=1881069 RepID=UPI002815E7D6|nr:DUF2213 domain-containing protein [Pelagibacterium sp. H642]WMT90145.1 DUF2213 domain-containing protein [Pelagibacterium sp. H642]